MKNKSFMNAKKSFVTSISVIKLRRKKEKKENNKAKSKYIKEKKN